MITNRNTATATTATASARAWPRRENPATSAVSRMCSPRCSAITLPSIASHRNRIEASSSVQINGAWNT